MRGSRMAVGADFVADFVADIMADLALSRMDINT